LSRRQLKILFDALMAGDGTYYKGQNVTCMAYYTTSRQLADDVQEMALKLGYFAHIIWNDDKRIDCERHRNYRVLITKRNVTTVYGENTRRIRYSGKVYCFNVRNHLFITRRNGKPTIQGNTNVLAQLAKPIRKFVIQQVSIPNDFVFLPGQQISIVDRMSGIVAPKALEAEIQQVRYDFQAPSAVGGTTRSSAPSNSPGIGGGSHGLGTNYAEIMPISYIDYLTSGL
jgi:hypothetical protein